MHRKFRQFWRSRRGGVAIYVALLLPVLILGAVIGVDGARLYTLQTSLQDGTDALALAAAAELDRKSSAITRANNAIATLVQNKQKFDSSGLTDVTVSQVRYLKGLPADDATPISSSYVTTDPTEARFVEVTVTPGTLKTMFPVSILGGSDVATATAQAVAGFDTAVCNFTPVYICNPYEGTGTSIFEAAKSPDMRRRLIALRQQGGSSTQYAPGNYGFLEPPTKPGANELRDMLGLTAPPACFLQSGVLLRTGFVATARDAINVRFDLYDGPMSGKKNDSAYRPSQNVRKGYSGHNCSQEAGEPPDYRGLPRDACFDSGTCSLMDGRMGDGDWNCEDYWATNFGSFPPPPGCAGTLSVSRYDVYRYEIDQGLVGNPSVGGETGAPQCFNGSGLSDNPDRRVLYGAVMNCQQLEAEYGLSGGSSPALPVAAFAKFFLTEPVGSGEDQDIFAELVGVIEPGNSPSGLVRDLVQLYR